MKLSTTFTEKSIWHKPFLMLCLTGCIAQSCSKSELALNPEALSNSESLSKKLREKAIKDTVNLKAGKNADKVLDSIGSHKHSDSLGIYTGVTVSKIFHRNKADTLHIPIALVPVNPPINNTSNSSQPPNNTGSTNTSGSGNNVVVNVPPVVTPKPNDWVPPGNIESKPISNEITIKTSQGLLLHPPKNLLIGLSKAYPLATDTYTGLLTQMPGGENEFWFYGKTNQYNYPTGEWVIQANGYSTIDLPTHAINARAGIDIQHPEYNQVICKIEYTIKDSQGNVVMFCKDTKGGFHPTFIPNERGNNHPKESQRFLPYGTYIVEFKNLTEGSINAPIRLTYNRAGGNATMGEYFDTIVNNQQTVTFAINIFEQDHDISMFKLNCNMVP
ncbi:hypothetical protein [Emticicia sp. C21]|uniref:hypothetical protein n=1 Tax=Emticicia sp. C21 TaxID=2302915 RepID=UPI000E3465C7|nr:hypothetical protein [Emticicia sp. C21]RFS17542.1 hypothetical protein D0T08_07155 [Emticicia sp. C21]